jgi:hypothetical protein
MTTLGAGWQDHFGPRYVSDFHSFVTGSGVHPVQWASGTFSWGTWREANYSPPSNAKVKTVAIPSLPPYVFMAWILIMYRQDDKGGGSLSPGGVNNFYFSISSRPALGSTQPPINGYRGLFPGGKAAGAWSWPHTSNYCRGQENMDLYIHSPIRHHGVMLN